MVSRSRSRNGDPHGSGASRSPSRSQSRPRRPPFTTPMSRSPRSPSDDRRSLSDRASRSRSPRRNGRYQSRSVERGRTRSRSWSRSEGSRSWSRPRSQTPQPKSTKIIVERLTKNVTEDHLREIFGQFGEIEDMELPMNRLSGNNRGTAYILYVHEADAEAAISHMHEAQLDGAIINVSIVFPRRKISPAPPTARHGANIDPRNARPGPSGAQSGGGAAQGGRAGGGRFGSRSDIYRPRSTSRSRSASPLAPRSDTRRYRSRSRSLSRSRSRSQSRSRSFSSRSPSRTPMSRGGRGGRERGGRVDDDNGGAQRRSPSRGSYDSVDSRSRSRSRARD